MGSTLAADYMRGFFGAKLLAGRFARGEHVGFVVVDEQNLAGRERELLGDGVKIRGVGLGHAQHVRVGGGALDHAVGILIGP